MKNSFAAYLTNLRMERSRKMAAKVPSWAEVDGLEFPSDLSTQQCSSERTAIFKARIAAQWCNDDSSRIADLTSGLGVDDWAFSKEFSSVLYNEMNEELSAATQSNFSKLGVSNVEFHNTEFNASTAESLLGAFNPDIIYLDPARRAESGRKVFRLEDCTPDVLSLLPTLWDYSQRIMLKLSPMADISLICRQLGREVKQVYCVETAGECKELLVLLEKDWDGEYSINATDCGDSFCFLPEEEKQAATILCKGLPTEGQLLFEPCAALMKAGAYSLICQRWGAEKIGISTQLYTTTSPLPLGKNFRILQVFPFSKAGFKDAARAFPRADVSARNVPISSEELRKKMGITSGGDTHIFAVTADCFGSTGTRILIACSRL